MKEAYNYQSCNENKKENSVIEELIDVLDENRIKAGEILPRKDLMPADIAMVYGILAGMSMDF